MIHWSTTILTPQLYLVAVIFLGVELKTLQLWTLDISDEDTSGSRLGLNWSWWQCWGRCSDRRLRLNRSCLEWCELINTGWSGTLPNNLASPCSEVVLNKILKSWWLIFSVKPETDSRQSKTKPRQLSSCYQFKEQQSTATAPQQELLLLDNGQ